MKALRTLAAVLTLVCWFGFLALDALWRSVVWEAVSRREGTFGELYGPVSFFRPVALYAALAGTLLCVVLLLTTNREPKTLK